MMPVCFTDLVNDAGLFDGYSEVAVGRSSTDAVKNGQLPSVTKAEPWNGKDGVVRTVSI